MRTGPLPHAVVSSSPSTSSAAAPRPRECAQLRIDLVAPLKPDDVMLDEEGQPEILDFGLAKLREERDGKARSLLEQAETASQMTEEGRLLGTPGYMAPEQVRGKEVDARTDVFALGVCLYEMLAGERRGDGEDPRSRAEVEQAEGASTRSRPDAAVVKSRRRRRPSA